MLRCGRDPRELAAGSVTRELYDLRADPGEHRSLIRADRDADERARAVAAELEGKLDEWIGDSIAAAGGS